MLPGLKSVRAPDSVRPIPSAQTLSVDIERIATVRTIANFFMIYLFWGTKLTVKKTTKEYLMRLL